MRRRRGPPDAFGAGIVGQNEAVAEGSVDGGEVEQHVSPRKWLKLLMPNENRG